MPDILMLLTEHEAFVPHAYQDSRGVWTIGIGTNIDKDHGGGITLDEARYLAMNRVQRFKEHLDTKIPWWRGLDPVRYTILLDMAFNLGPEGLLKFKNTLKAIEEERWVDAANGMRASLWYDQVGNRAKRLAIAMETGVLPKKWW